MSFRVLSLLAYFALAATPAAAQSIALNGTPPATGVTVGAATPVAIDVSGGPGNATDWIALYPSGAADSGYLAWSYLNGSTSPPATGLVSATIAAIAPMTAGSYEWRLFANNGTTRLATSTTLTVTASPAVLTVNGAVAPAPASAVAGGSIVVAIANGPGNTTDWVALAPAGAPDSTILDWRYLNGTTVAPTTGMTGGTVTFIAPSSPGGYEVRFFAVNSYARLATSGPLTVAATPAALTVNGVAPPTAVSLAAGTYVTLGVSDGPGNPGDWVGLYAVGTADSALLSWRYLNGSTTLPAIGVTNATMSFGAPLTAGSYEFRFFSANTYTRLATSTSLVVSAATAQLSVNGTVAPGSTTALPGTQAVVSVASGPGNVGDWVGLYLAGTPDTALLDWRYLNDTATPPSTGLTTGTLTFRVPTPASTYEFRFFMDNTYGRLATSGPLVVPQTPAQIAVNGVPPPTSVTVTPGSTVTATISGGPGSPTDWVALATQGAADTSFLSWQYLNGSTQPPATGLTSGTVSVTLPATAGTYELRLFASNSYQRIVTSAPIVASAAPPVVAAALTSPFPGTTFNAPASLTLTATATITGGTLQRVDFYDGAALIGSSTTAPYQTTWFGPSQGLHTLIARAVDSTNAVTDSAAVPVTIAPAGATIGTLGEPIAGPPGGVYGPGLAVSLTSAPGTTIHYTTNGSDPDLTSPTYTAPIVLGLTTTIRARAHQAGWTESGIATATFTIDTTPPVIQAAIFPKPNPVGWNNSPITVTFTCVDQSVVTSCPAPVNVAQDGAAQLVSVTATDALGLQGSLAVTVNIDSVPPVVSLTSPTADLSTTAATLSLSAATTDVGSGLAAATCYGQAAVPAGGMVNCSVGLAPGQNTVVLSAVDSAGNSASAGLKVIRVTTATALSLAPTTLALAVGDTHVLTATTDAGLPATGVTWTSSNPSVISFTPENDGTITAEALGQATVTATVGSLTAEAQVSVLPGAVSAGEAIWTVAPTPGRYTQALIKANPVLDEDPDMFSVEVDAVTQARTVKAVRAADGATLWSEAVSDRSWPDALGGLLVAVTGGPTVIPNVSGTILRRIGGGGIAPWEYAALYIDNVATAPDGTVYLTEFAVVEPFLPPGSWFPNGGYGSVGFIVVLDGRTGAVRARVPMPNGSFHFREQRQYPASGCEHYKVTENPQFGPITVMENGDAYVQVHKQDVHNDEPCADYAPPTSTQFVSNALYVWRVNAAGEAMGFPLTSYSNTFPMDGTYIGAEFQQAGSNRPDGRGGVLSTWYRSVNIQPFVEEYHATTIGTASIVADRLAPWVQFEGWNNVMVTSGGVIYVPGESSGEITAISTDTWTQVWTAASVVELVQGLDSGGLQMLTWDGTTTVLQERDASGVVVRSYPTAVSSTLLALRDQDVLHGLWLNGALAMVAAPTPRATEWTFLGGEVDRCTPAEGRLYRDLPLAQRPHIGLVPNAQYSYDLIDTPANPAGQFQSFQAAGVKAALTEWNDTSTAEGLNRTFRIRTDEERQEQVQPTIGVRKQPLGVDDKGNPIIGAFPPPANHPGHSRITGGTMFLTTNTDYLMQEEGYKVAAMHEAGHALGLAHPKSLIRGGTVMNTFYTPQSPSNVLQTRDDRGRNLARRPTSCDVEAVRATQTP